MKTWHEHDEDDDDWDDDDGTDAADRLSAAELPDPSDTDDGLAGADDTDTVPCPFCRRPVYAFADVCPSCRNFVGGSDDPTAHESSWRRRPAWFLVGLALSAAILFGFVFFLVRMW